VRKLIPFAAIVVAMSVMSAPSLATPHAMISIGSIDAVFVPAMRATRYTVSRFHLNGKAEKVTVTWKLALELVDKAGAPDPGTPGSGAAVDVGCTNAGVGTPNPAATVVEPGHPTSAFTWHHPDAADSVPPGKYNCDHTDMGLRGHQGLITVVVADKNWSCTATYKGTNSSTNKSVENKTASEPKCSPVGG
jgi:hypothetical protein